MGWQEMSWAYVAGFTDGEGSISCIEGLQRNGVNVRRSWEITLYQNDRQVLDEISAFLTGHGIKNAVRTHARPDRIRKGHAGSFYLSVKGAASVFKFLLATEGYLIVKHEKATEVINRLEELIELAENGELGSPRANAAYRDLRKVG